MKIFKVAIITLCLCFLFVACKQECTHSYQSEITQAPSCTQEGVETFTCVHCQDSYTQPVPVIEHAYAPGAVEKEPTCAEEGIQKYVCVHCSAEKTQPVEKLAHTFEETTVTKEPNCTEKGQCVGDCVVCGAKGVTGELPTNDVHVFTTTVVREATCTDKGEGLNTCTLCQHSESCQFELKKHTYGKDTILTDATCTKKGKLEHTCKVCGHTAKETISATGHSWTGATCTKAGTCSVCGATGKKTDHNYTVITDTKYTEKAAGELTKECKDCGKKVTQYRTRRYTINLDTVRSKLSAYAKSRGFKVKLHSFSEEPYKYSITANSLDTLQRGGNEWIIKNGKTKIDHAYSAYASSLAGIGAYTLHINVYHKYAGPGVDYFVVLLKVTSQPSIKKRTQTETLRKEVVSVFLYKKKMTLSTFESVIMGYML